MLPCPALLPAVSNRETTAQGLVHAAVLYRQLIPPAKAASSILPTQGESQTSLEAGQKPREVPLFSSNSLQVGKHSAHFGQCRAAPWSTPGLCSGTLCSAETYPLVTAHIRKVIPFYHRFIPPFNSKSCFLFVMRMG